MWKKIINSIKEFFRIFRLEFKINFGGHRLKMLKFMGILVIPFLYGFIYICAMYDPLTDTKGDIDITFVASDKMATNWDSKDLKNSEDKVYASLRQNIKSKKDTLSQIYGSSTIKESDLIKENEEFKKEIEKHHVSIVLKPIYNEKEDPKHIGAPLNLTEYLGSAFADAIALNATAPSSLLQKILSQIPIVEKTTLITRALGSAMTNYSNPVDVYFNYKKNFVIGFGANSKIAGTPTLINLFNSVMSSQTPSTFSKISVKDAIFDVADKRLQTQYKITLTAAQKTTIAHLFAKTGVKQHFIDPTIYINEFEGGKPLEKYGIGLAPLFISIGLWIGALSTTLMITPKTHERGTSKVKAFFAKLGLIWIANILQVTILFGALAALGFASALGTTLPLFFLTGYLVSFLFATMVFSIRCMIPAKITGLFTVTILLLIQITSSGALFPTYVQPKFFQFMNNIVPFNYSVSALKETLVNPNMTNWAMNLFVLLLMAIPFAVAGSLIYKRRKNKHELNNPDAFKADDDVRTQEVSEIEAPLFKKLKTAFSGNKKENSKTKKNKAEKGGE